VERATGKRGVGRPCGRPPVDGTGEDVVVAGMATIALESCARGDGRRDNRSHRIYQSKFNRGASFGGWIND